MNNPVLPALVVLAAEPLYLLVDTAVVGHLGRVPLAGLAIGGTLLAVTAWLGTVLAYGTTGRAARSFGAGFGGSVWALVEAGAAREFAAAWHPEAFVMRPGAPQMTL